MITWLNGTFGAGKTTTSRILAETFPQMLQFDPETVGYMLRPNLVDYPVADFQDWKPWRVLTPIVADQLIDFAERDLLVAQTVLNERYWNELDDGLRALGHDVLHVLLDADVDNLRDRIEADTHDAGAREWRLDHLSEYQNAREWLMRSASLIVDTTPLTPAGVAERVAAAVQARAAG